VISVGEIDYILKKIVDEAMSERLPALIAKEIAKVPTTTGRELSPLVDIRHACQFLKISETKLRGMCRAGSIPFHKVDGSYRFDLAELHEATKVGERLKRR
jgi:excisionase family DNA binding protein